MRRMHERGEEISFPPLCLEAEVQHNQSCCLLCPLQGGCGNSSHGNMSNIQGSVREFLKEAPPSLFSGY